MRTTPLTLPENVEQFLVVNKISFPRVNVYALRDAAELFRTFESQAGAVHYQARSEIERVLTGYCGAWHEQLRNHQLHLDIRWYVLDNTASQTAERVADATKKLDPLLADLRDDVIEFVADYHKVMDRRARPSGSATQSDLAQHIIDTVRFRCDTANIEVTRSLAPAIDALDKGMHDIWAMIASTDDADRHVGAVSELRIDPDMADKLAHALTAYPDEFTKHVRTLVDGLASLTFTLAR